MPADIETLLSSWDLKERKPTHTNTDFLINFSIGEEVREKLFVETPFVMDSAVCLDADAQSDRLCIAESTLKVNSPKKVFIEVSLSEFF